MTRRISRATRSSLGAASFARSSRSKLCVELQADDHASNWCLDGSHECRATTARAEHGNRSCEIIYSFSLRRCRCNRDALQEHLDAMLVRVPRKGRNQADNQEGMQMSALMRTQVHTSLQESMSSRLCHSSDKARLLKSHLHDCAVSISSSSACWESGHCISRQQSSGALQIEQIEHIRASIVICSSRRVSKTEAIASRCNM